MQKILLIAESEDAPQLAEEMKTAGYEVEAASFAEATDRLRALGSARAIIIDLSDRPDFRALKDIVGTGAPADETPSLALLSKSQLVDGLAGLPVDDFAVRPLRPHELEARVRHLLGRRQGTDSPDVLRQGALVIDLVGYRVFVAGVHIELTFKEYELLRFLGCNPDRVFTREALLDKVWGYDYFGGARTVDVHIRRLRSKIEIGEHAFIETVRSVGYRFRPSSSLTP